MSRVIRTPQRKITLFLWILSAAFPLAAAAPDSVSGLILSDTVWTVASSPIYVTGTVTVGGSAGLTIEPGTTVLFDSATGLVVAGKIIANGVIFTSKKPEGGGSVSPKQLLRSSSVNAAPGDWLGIEFQNAANVGSVFTNNTVKYGGGGSNGSNIFYKTGAFSIEIRNGFIARSALHGINTRASSPVIHNTIITENGGFGVFSDLLSNFLIDSSETSYNLQGGVRVPTNSTPQIKNTDINDNGIGIFVDNSATPIIQNNVIQYNGVGVQVTNATLTLNISNNTIQFNTNYGLLNTNTTVSVKAENNYWGASSGPYNPVSNPTGAGNAVSPRVDYTPWKTQAAALPVKNITGNITVPTVWKDSVYVVKANIVMSSTLTIYPGTVVKFEAARSMQVTGTMIAAGKPDSLIVFTSDKDDTYGGDSNGDGTTTQPAPGDWNRVEFNNAGASASVLRHALLRYGGSSTTGNLYVNTATPTIANIFSSNSSTQGIYINAAVVNLDSVNASGNASHGIDVNNGGLNLRNGVMQGNGSRGIFADGTALVTVARSRIIGNGVYGIEVNGTTGTLQRLDSSVVSFNGSWGIYQNDGSLPQRFSYNRVEGNVGGFWINNLVDSVLFLADTVINHANDGIVTTKANLLGNVLSNNRYPIALIGNVNTKYSGNTISGNQINNAVGLRLNGVELYDTLRVTLPAGMNTKTYVLLENTASLGVAAGKTFVIEPGVIFKMADGMFMNVDGTIIANGTASAPIIFTSYRDSTYGGKTSQPGVFTTAAPNDWRYIQILNTASNSQFNFCFFRFGGRDGNGMVYTNNVNIPAQWTNLTFARSSSYGMLMYRTIITLNAVRVDSNGYSGIDIYGSNPGSDVIIRNSSIGYNGGAGLYAETGSGYREVSNSIIHRNATYGIVVDNGQVPQTYLGNQIRFNTIDGVKLYNPNRQTDEVMLVGNTITDNGSVGALTTAARFIDNVFERNNYAIGVFGKQGNIYTDNSNPPVDGNIIAQNNFNKAIAVIGTTLWDTIRSVFPVQIPSKTYHVIQDIQVASGDTLVIQPGVNLKFVYSTSGTQAIDFDIYGTLIAEGSPVGPITFTSWRDTTVGGKTSALNDSLGPAKGHWNHITFRNGSGNSRVRNVHFRYGGRDGYEMVYFEQNLAPLQFARNRIEFSDANGITVYNTVVTFDSLIIAGNDGQGIWLQNNATVQLSVKNSVIGNNGGSGIYKEAAAKLLLVDQCVIHNNGNHGIDAYNNTVPLIVSNSRIHHNAAHGIFAYSLNNAVDTLLLFLNNKVFNNAGVGIMSSRAYYSADSIYNNRYGIGLVGQLSLAGTGNANGNVYDDNAIFGNLYHGVTAVEWYVEGKIGFSFPAGYGGKVFAVRGDLEVVAGDTLMIAPGSIFKFSKEWGDSRLHVYGTLLSVGTGNQKIVFTSWRDDSYGGDTNLDTTATLPVLGDWRRIYINAATSNNTLLKHTIVRYGGLGGYPAVDINTSAARVESSFVSYSYTGIQLSYTTAVLFGNEIHHNTYGVYVYGAGTPAINYNNIYSNTTGMETYYVENPINAENNYWGASTGPLKNTGANQNPTGAGNILRIVGNGDADYQPYLTARQGLLFGDVSGNGQITAFDGSLILQYLVELITFNTVQRTVANVSGDTSVSALDASYILRYVVGLISGFPGLGKQSLETDIATAFAFAIEKGKNPDEFDLIMRLNKPVNVFGMTVKLSFDTTLVQPTAMAKTMASDSMVMVHHFPSGRANLAMAGLTPMNAKGDVARMTFRLLDPAKARTEVLFTVEKFVLNETDVTSDVGSIVMNVRDIAEIPTVYGLSQNYPNPFNPSTTVEYQLPVASTVRISIYNMLGQEVKTLVNSDQTAGFYAVRWNGTDNHNIPVATGVYIYKIDARGVENQTFSRVKKMLLVK